LDLQEDRKPKEEEQNWKTIKADIAEEQKSRKLNKYTRDK